MKVIIENVRSISGYHVVPLRKLTLFVGENSSGKSTFLASVAAVSDSQAFPGTAAFNEPPYDLGGYDTIATFKGGRGGRRKPLGWVLARKTMARQLKLSRNMLLTMEKHQTLHL